jgi:hypothetical protein
MSNPEVIPVVMVVMAFSFLTAREVMHAWRRKDETKLKHATWQKLLETGQLDRKTLEDIVSNAEGRGGGWLEAILNGSLLFVVGWIGIFVGLAFLAGGACFNDEDMVGGGFIVGLISLGLATLPLAWREVQERFRHEGQERI